MVQFSEFSFYDLVGSDEFLCILEIRSCKVYHAFGRDIYSQCRDRQRIDQTIFVMSVGCEQSGVLRRRGTAIISDAAKAARVNLFICISFGGLSVVFEQNFPDGKAGAVGYVACGHSELTELFGSHVSLPRRGKTLIVAAYSRIITLAEKSGRDYSGKHVAGSAWPCGVSRYS